MLQEAIDAIQRGQRARARDLLSRLLKVDGSNPQYWLWMSATVDTLKERIYCLQAVMRFEPENRLARQGLILAGALPADEQVKPVPPIRRRWEVSLDEGSQRHGLARLWGNPAVRLLVLFPVALVVTGLVLVGVLGLGRARPVALAPTDTPGPRPTFTLTPTYIGERAAPATPTPIPSGLVPLWTLLEATYTPTPIYINTPHAVSEAYRSGQRAFTRGDLPAALQFFKQAIQVDPDAPDLHYYIGDVQYMLENP
jgi:tetratricopeptide (TPR) repeat protein